MVTGFSIGGWEVDGNGAGVDGAKIIVDGQEKSITATNGYYKLDQVALTHGPKNVKPQMKLADASGNFYISYIHNRVKVSAGGCGASAVEMAAHGDLKLVERIGGGGGWGWRFGWPHCLARAEGGGNCGGGEEGGARGGDWCCVGSGVAGGAPPGFDVV